MKKVVLSLAVLFSVALVACNSNKKEEAVDTDSVIAETEVVAADSDTAVAAEAVETVANGDTQVAVEAVEETAPAK